MTVAKAAALLGPSLCREKEKEGTCGFLVLSTPKVWAARRPDGRIDA